MQTSSLDDSMIYCLSSLPEEEYKTVLMIFKKFEACELKDQKLSKTMRKRFNTSTLDCKGVNFKPIRGIDISSRKGFLSKVANQEISFSELSVLCREHKRIQEVKQNFMKYHNLSSWDAAQEKYPVFTRPERLKPFVGMQFKQGFPPSFVTYCQQAKRSLPVKGADSLQQPPAAGILQVSVKDNAAHIFSIDAIDVDSNTFLSTIIQNTTPFTGISLSIVTRDKVIALTTHCFP